MTNIETIKNIKVGNVLHPLDATYLDGHPMSDFQLKSDMGGGWSEAVTAEETARKEADTTLQANIDKKVSKDDETWLENFMPKIILNKKDIGQYGNTLQSGTVKSVTVGDNVAANYATISARLSRYGGVVIGTTIYEDNTPKGRVVQVHSGQGQSFPNVLCVTAIYNYGEHFTEEFANSKYEIVLNYNSDGEFVSGTYEFRPICEVFEIRLSGRSLSELGIDKTYEDFNHFRDSLTGYKSTPLIILNDDWTRSSFILTRYDSHGYGSSNDYHWVYELSFISIKGKQLIGYYIVVEKDKTTVTPFEFQPATQEDLKAATDEINANFGMLVEDIMPRINTLETGKQDTIGDLATIRTNAANGQTAFNWGDHKMEGYVKPFIINITFNDSTQKYEVVDDIDVNEVQNALNAHNLILLKGDDVIIPLTKAFGNAEDAFGITLQFFTIYGDGNEHEDYIMYIAEDGVAIDYFGYEYATDDQIQTLQANIDKKVDKSDGTWLGNFMPRIQLNGDGTTSAPTTGNNFVVNYEGASYYLRKYGGIVTGFDDGMICGRVVQVKDSNDSKLYVTAIFNDGANFSGDYANSLYEIVLTFDTDDAFANGTYTVKPLGGGGLPTIQAGHVQDSEVFNGINPWNALGPASHAEGDNTQSMGFASHAEGSNTIAANEYSHAEGSYNVEDPNAIHSVGIGGGSKNRKDAHRITYDGKHYIIGIGGFDGTKATKNLTNEKDLATIINNYESRIAALETALAGVQSQLKSI